MTHARTLQLEDLRKVVGITSPANAAYESDPVRNAGLYARRIDWFARHLQ